MGRCTRDAAGLGVAAGAGAGVGVGTGAAVGVGTGAAVGVGTGAVVGIGTGASVGVGTGAAVGVGTGAVVGVGTGASVGVWIRAVFAGGVSFASEQAKASARMMSQAAAAMVGGRLTAAYSGAPGRSSSAAKWHLEKRPGATSVSGGSEVWQTSSAIGQRGWK